eukprot:SAG11_NODE_12694_length_690_cov_1.087986_1_plen_146_part_01
MRAIAIRRGAALAEPWSRYLRAASHGIALPRQSSSLLASYVPIARRVLSSATTGDSSSSGFDLSAEQLEIQAVAREFAQQELPELARELERTNLPVPDVWRTRFAAEGYLGINTSAELGGLGQGHLVWPSRQTITELSRAHTAAYT